MRVVVQRVKSASVKVDEKLIAEIQKGYLLLVGLTHNDTERELDYIANKIAKLRVFPDDSGKMNRSLTDVGGAILSVSQFTLYADTKDGNRPSFTEALSGEKAEPLFALFNEKLRQVTNTEVQTGEFGAYMDVSLENDGPVTILIER